MDMKKIAKEYLKRTCGDMIEPNAKDIIKYCTPIIATNMRIIDYSKIGGGQEENDFENLEITKIARNAFIMGYLCGQNDTY